MRPAPGRAAQPEAFQELGDSAPLGRRADPIGDVLLDREVGKQRRRLAHEGDLSVARRQQAPRL